MKEARALEAGALRWRCDPAQFSFQTTSEIEDLDTIFGQARAVDAVQFGVGIRQDGYNLYALGPAGLGKQTAVEQFLNQRAATQPAPPDWCYVHNFEQPQKPRAMQLSCGLGEKLRNDMERLVEDLRTEIPAALEIEAHRTRLQELDQESKEKGEKAFEDLSEKAEKQGVRLIRTPTGFAMAPVREGQVISPEEFEKLPEEERKRTEAAVGELQQDLRKLMEQIPQWRKQLRDKVKSLNQEAARFAIAHLLTQLRKQYAEVPHVLKYFDAVEQDAVERSDEFHPPEGESQAPPGMPGQNRNVFNRYKVNLLVDNKCMAGAPVVLEDYPTFSNLLGRVEHEARMGTLVTDFTLIRPGALHLANGGYLVVEANRLLRHPFAWEGLKRALQRKQIRIESLSEALSMATTVTLEPEPIPLQVKVVVLGDRQLYYMLYQLGPDFAELFKVGADFEEVMDRTAENCRHYASFLSTLARRGKHRPLDPSGVARIVEQGARMAGDAEKLSAHMGSIADLLRESDYWAGEDGANAISSFHVDKAIEKQTYRADRIRERIQENIRRGTILIDTQGEHVGQINGLSVLDLGNFSFGQPSRITATARLGNGEVVDIEREAKLGGAIHSKGVLILSSFLASRYARERPLSLSASLVFEQSYGMVDGDSASVAELCALMSALAELPVKQNFAVTGSVNQHGQVQPIGGANQKIEGFFDVCRGRGLTGDQGVLIPASNVKHLMLRSDVVEAAANGQFHVYAIETVDQAIALLTGVDAGERDEQGQYPAGSVNHRVEIRLQKLSELRQKFSAEKKSEKPSEKPND